MLAVTRAALFRALGGDSLVAVEVEPPAPWRPGRVVLSAPADWAGLLERAWARVAEQVPAGWELVVKPVGVVPSSLPAAASPPLRRAA